jgi:hypothetical protein
LSIFSIFEGFETVNPKGHRRFKLLFIITSFSQSHYQRSKHNFAAGHIKRYASEPGGAV